MRYSETVVLIMNAAAATPVCGIPVEGTANAVLDTIV